MIPCVCVCVCVQVNRSKGISIPPLCRVLTSTTTTPRVKSLWRFNTSTPLMESSPRLGRSDSQTLLSSPHHSRGNDFLKRARWSQPAEMNVYIYIYLSFLTHPGLVGAFSFNFFFFSSRVVEIFCLVCLPRVIIVADPRGFLKLHTYLWVRYASRQEVDGKKTSSLVS